MVYAVKDKADFLAQLKNADEKLVLVDFFATWCGPCKKIAPELVKLSKQYKNKLVILKVDVDKCEDLAIKYKISCMPTFVFIKKSATVERISGATPEKLKELIIKLSD